MGKISFRKVILGSYLIYLIFSLMMFLYFDRIYYQNIKERLISENSYSVQSVMQFFDAEKDSIAKDARFVVNHPAIHSAFVNDKYINFYFENEFDINNPKLENMNGYKYTELSYILSRILGKTLYGSGITDINIALFDKNANPISNVPGIGDSYLDTGKESYIVEFVSEANKYSNLEPIGVIVLKDGRLFVKGVDRVYAGEPKGVTAVTIEINDFMLKNIKNSINKEIVVLAENEVKLSTMDIDKLAFGNELDAFQNGDILFKTFTINNKEMGFSFYPIKDFDSKIIAYIGTGFDMNIVNDIFIRSMVRFIPVEVITSLLLFLILYTMLRLVLKPLSEIIHITEKIGEGNYEIKHLSSKVFEYTKIIESISKMAETIENRENELKVLSSIDKLTQIYNRQKIEEILKLEIERSKRYNKSLSIIMLDIDGFKEVNDTFGHEVGDIVLTEFATVLKNNIRKIDIVGRWGGEEFLLICPETDIEGAVALALNLKNKIEEYKFSIIDRKTASFGVIKLMPEDDINSVMRRVDNALYNAKKLGRNRVEIIT